MALNKFHLHSVCQPSCTLTSHAPSSTSLTNLVCAPPSQVTDTTTFTDEARRAEVDAWLYETCTQCLQHMVDIVVQFYPVVQSLVPRILALLSNFIRYLSLSPPPSFCHIFVLDSAMSQPTRVHRTFGLILGSLTL